MSVGRSDFNGTGPVAPFSRTVGPLGGLVHRDSDGAGSTYEGLADWEEGLLRSTPTTKMDLYLKSLQETDRELLLSKHKDYGPGNIANAPGGAVNGLLVRMHDKMERLKHLHETSADPQHESVIDTLTDLRNYALIYQMVLEGEWPA